MKAAKPFKWITALVATTTLLVVVFVVPSCVTGDCASGATWHLSTNIADLLGVDTHIETPSKVTVLVVGVDSRKGAKQVHCDAIHSITIDTVQDTVEFVNIPRGTYSFIPRQNNWVPQTELLEVVNAELKQAELDKQAEEAAWFAEIHGENAVPLPLILPQEDVVAETPEVPDLVGLAWAREQYISNVCEYLGVDEFVSRVEKITGQKVDYRVLVGFSQAQGVLRALSFDPTTTLQYLRHRKSYALGDVQRSYNQSLFLEDLLVNRIDMVEELPKTAQFALYQLIDTDMPYAVARGLLAWAQASRVQSDATRITHRTAPAGTPRAQDQHYNEDAAKEQVEQLYAQLRVYDPSFTVKDTQPTLLAYIQQQETFSYNALVNGDKARAREVLQPLVDQQIWQQIEDATERQKKMETIAILDSTLSWFETYSEERTVEIATSMIWSLELEQGSESAIARIRQHLGALLSNRVYK
ncbi:TPA: hypothetical protein DEB00_01935 [Candidatus Uhrbacteria bacterium]|nr:hypothetical protein [Candidatus Uhrbacteria bacterium]